MAQKVYGDIINKIIYVNPFNCNNGTIFAIALFKIVKPNYVLKFDETLGIRSLKIDSVLMYSDVNIMWSIFKDDILTNFDDEIGLLFYNKYILQITQLDILSQQLV